MILVYLFFLNELGRMEKEMQYSGCTISLHPCQCFEKLTKEQEEFLNKNSTKVNYQTDSAVTEALRQSTGSSRAG